MRKKTLQDFIIQARIIHGDKYDYSKSIYISVKKKLVIICNCCKLEFLQTPDNHINNKRGCKYCSISNRSKKLKKNIKELILSFNKVHNNLYNYLLINDENYKNVNTNISIICNLCKNIFKQSPANHLIGNGCPICFLNNKKVSIEFFIKKASKIHNKLYSYENNNILNISFKDKINIFCKKCSLFFKQLPGHHLRGQGCKICYFNKKRITIENFIKRSDKIHNNLFEYKIYDESYIDYKNKINIFCKKCLKNFNQLPNDHLRGKGCLTCSKNISKPEVKWLDSLNIKEENRQVKLNKIKYIRVDGFCPLTNTVYEFYGDFWHGNPKIYKSEEYNKKCKKTFGELFNKTECREKLIKEAGYNLVVMWESDFNYVK